MVNEQKLLAGEWLAVTRCWTGFDAELLLKDWWLKVDQQDYSSPAALALFGGLQSDRMAFAFAAGYQSALRHKFPSLGEAVGAFCVTEPQGAHPRQIQSELNNDDGIWRLSGQKSFVSMADLAEQVFILVKKGECQGRPDLAMVQLPVSSCKATVSPSLAYVPELVHGALAFDLAIDSSSILPGDGYRDYSKPFRVLEDCYVSISVLGYLLTQGVQRGWPATLTGDLLSCIQLLISLISMQTSASNTHLVLDSALRQASGLYAQATQAFEADQDEVVSCWKRDKPLLGFASKARAQRFKTACNDLDLQYKQ